MNEYIKSGYKCKLCGEEIIVTRFSNVIFCPIKKDGKHYHSIYSKDWEREYMEEWRSVLHKAWLCNWVDKIDGSKPNVSWIEAHLKDQLDSICINQIEIDSLKNHIKQLKKAN